MTPDQIEASFDNDREAHALLALIDAEFQSDPMSVQCFDLRIVERVKLCVTKHKKDPCRIITIREVRAFIDDCGFIHLTQFAAEVANERYRLARHHAEGT
jgi:hypothetical protein